MKSSNWQPCIVSYFDLPDIKAQAETGAASLLMLKLHSFALTKIEKGLRNHSFGYVWNDSILLLSYITKPAAKRRELILELSEFKQALDRELATCSYVISVRGKAFPTADNAATRVVVLKTSSWAMGNAFAIEKELGKHKAHWYIDSRITQDLKISTPFKTAAISLSPKKESRDIHMYKGHLHKYGDGIRCWSSQTAVENG